MQHHAKIYVTDSGSQDTGKFLHPEFMALSGTNRLCRFCKLRLTVSWGQKDLPIAFLSRQLLLSFLRLSPSSMSVRGGWGRLCQTLEAVLLCLHSEVQV